LKGAASAIGALRVAAVAATIELTAHFGNTTGLQSAIEELQSEMTTVIAELARVRASLLTTL
jgi:HPt (histidine-containing phosphotransfer) domain-containing protein